MTDFHTNDWHEGFAEGYDHGEAAAMASRYTMEEMDHRCYESVEEMLDQVLRIIANTRHEDDCCSRGCACRSYERPEPCDLLCNCMVGSVIGEVLYALSKISPLDAPTPEPPAPNASLPASTDGVVAMSELAKAGKAWHAAKAKERERAAEMYAAIAAFCKAGGSEVEAARLAGVDRMTVRRALGKL